MGKYPKKPFEILVKQIGSEQGVYSAVRRKEEKFKAVKPEILFYLVAAEHGIKISKYEKNEEVLRKVDELLSRSSSAPVKNNLNTNNNEKQKPSEIDPFTIPLSKFNLFSDLAKECKIKKPYSKEIDHAIKILEEFIRKKLNLNKRFYGTKLIEEANKQKIFEREDKGEERGLYFLYSSAMLWLRNSGGHERRKSEKEECLEIILFVDYLIKLFDKIVKDKNDSSKIQTN